MIKRLTACLYVAGSLFMVSPAWAAPLSWNAGTGEWSTAGNWNPAQVPTTGDNAFIQNAGTAQITDGGSYAVDALFIASTGAGALSITNGNLTTDGFYIGSAGNLGTLTVDGAAASLTLGTNFSSSNSDLTIRNSGTVSGAGMTTFYVGTVSGPSSILVESNGVLDINSSFSILGNNNGATNTLTVQSGGRATFDGNFISFGYVAGSTGQLNLNGTAGSRGVFETEQIEVGDGAGLIDFDGGILRALASESDFLKDFAAGGVTLGAGGGYIDSNGFNITIAAPIDGAGTLVKQGAGTLTLSATNSYGNTAIQAGTLAISSDANLGAGDVSLDGGELLATASFTLNTPTNLGVANSSTGTFSAAAGQTLTLSPTSFNTGLTTSIHFGSAGNTGVIIVAPSGGNTIDINATYSIDYGTLRAGNATLYNTTNFIASTTVNAGATLDYNDHTSGVDIKNLLGAGTVNTGSSSATDLGISQGNFSGVIQGAGDLIKYGAGTLILTGTSTYAGTTTISAGTLQIGNGGAAGALPSGNIINNATLEFNRNDSFTIANTISGTGSVVANNPSGTLKLTADNSFSGGLTIEDGYVSLEHAHAAGTGTITAQNASINLVFINGGLTIANNFQLDDDLDIWPRSGGATISGKISGTGNFRLRGVATLTLTNDANDFTGDVEITYSDLSVSSDGQLGNAANDVLFDEAKLIVTDTFATSRTFESEDTDPVAVEIASGKTLTINGNITGSNGLTKTGAGTLTVASANTYTGGVNINAGTLSISADNNLGAGGGTLTLAGGTLQSTGTFTSSSRATTFAAATTSGVDVTAGNTLTWVGNFTGSTGNWVKTGAGILKLNGQQGTTGTVTVNEGELQLNSGGGGNSLIQGNLTVGDGSGAADSAVVRLLTTSQIADAGTTVQVLSDGLFVSYGEILGALNIQGGHVSTGTHTGLQTNGLLTLSGGTIDGTANFYLNANADIQANANQSVISASTVILNATQTITVADGAQDVDLLISSAMTNGGLLKTGAGTLELTGVSTYGSGTTVNAGMLKVNNASGSATGTGALAINNGATLGGAGFIGGVTTINNGGILAPGNSAGTITINNDLILNSGSILNYELDTPGVVGAGVNDLTIVNGALTLDGVMNITDLGGFGDGTYRLFNYTGALTNNGLLFNAVPGVYNLTVNTATAGEINLLVATATEQYWNGPNTSPTGAIEGGTGTWDAATTNWTNAAGNASFAWLGGLDAIFQGAAGTVTIANGFTANPGDIYFNTDGYVLAATGSGSLDIAGGSAIDVNAGDATISAPITGVGALTKTGAGTLALTGANTFTGDVNINAGTLSVSSAASLGNANNAINLDGTTLNSSATFTLGSGHATTLGAGGGTFDVDAAKNLTYAANIAGAGGLTKTGAGTLTLSGANTYAGGTSLNAGTLVVGSDTALGDAAGALTINGGTLAANATHTLANDVVVNNDFSFYTAVSQPLNLNNVNLGGATRTLTGLGASDRLNVNGVVSGTAGVNYDATYGSRIYYQGAAPNTLTGTTTVGNGFTLNLKKDDNITAIADALTINAGGVVVVFNDEQIADAATVQVDGSLYINSGVTETLGNLAGAGSVLFDHVSNLNVEQGSFAGVFNESVSNGSLYLTKTSAGTLTLTGASTIDDGAVVVDAGKLVVNNIAGSATGAVPLTVNAGGALGGSGFIGGVTTINNGGILAPGNSAGTITINNDLILNSGSILDYELDTPGVVGAGVNDLTVVNGALTLDGVMNITDLGGFGDGTYRLFNYTGALTDNGLLFGTAPAPYDFTLDTATAGEINLTVAAATTQYWDGPHTSPNGAVNGGTATWDAVATNWTNAAGNANFAWVDSLNAVFAGDAGTVTVASGFAPTVSSLSFQTDGYQLAAAGTGAVNLATDVPIIVTTGVTTISAPLTGAGGFTKTGGGALVLTGMSDYTGDTILNDGQTTVASGGEISDTDALILADNAADEATLIISGTGYVGALDTHVGDEGIGHLSVLSGGDFDTDYLGVAVEVGSTGDVTVSGANSQIITGGVDDTVVVGERGNGTMNILSGGLVETTDFGIGEYATGVGEVTVSGTDSTLDTYGNLVVGISGHGTLHVLDDAEAYAVNLLLGYDPTGVGVMNVDGAGAYVETDNDVVIGYQGLGTLNITNGGEVYASDDIAIGNVDETDLGVGHVTVDGTDSMLIAEEFLTVGGVSESTLDITNGGYVEAAAADIGSYAGDIGKVVVDGAGSQLAMFDEELYIGNEGAGALTLRNGGTLDQTGIIDDAPVGVAVEAGSTGVLNIGAASGDAAAAPGVVIASGVEGGAGDATLTFNHTSSDYYFTTDGTAAGDAVVISGSIHVNALAGTTYLTGDNTFTGGVTLDGGLLVAANDSGSATGSGDVDIMSGATLGGNGVIDGSVNIADGGILAPGMSPGTLTINTDLTLNSGSIINYELDTPNVVGAGVNDLTIVNGNFTLDGVMNITDLGAFGAGDYTLFQYAGALTDNGLLFGTTPVPFDLAVNAGAGVVTLTVTDAVAQYWDGSNTAPNGTIDGGTGTWDAATTNWTNATGNANTAWFGGLDATFTGAAGTVTIADGFTANPDDILVYTDGYVFNAAGSGSLGLSGGTSVFINTGTTTINAPITGGAGDMLIKNGSGTLVLAGDNTYVGGTTLDAGTLVIASNTALGTGDLTINSGTLANDAANRDLANNLIVNGDFNYDITFGQYLAVGDLALGNATHTITGVDAGEFDILGVVSGTAGLNLASDAATDRHIVFLGSDANTLTGTLTVGDHVLLNLIKDANVTAVNDDLVINAGGLVGIENNEQINDNAVVQVDGRLGLAFDIVETIGTIAGSGAIEMAPAGSGSTLNLNSGTFSGNITGNGQVVKNTAGTLTLSGDSTFDNGTTLNAGTLLVGGSGNPLGASLTIAGGTLGDVGDSLTQTITPDTLVQADFATNVTDALAFTNVDLDGGTRTVTGMTTHVTDFQGVIQNGGLTLASATTPPDVTLFYFSGGDANTYTGDTTVGDNTRLYLLKSTDVTAIAGDLIINAGGLVDNMGSGQIADTATVTNNGTWQLYDGVTEAIDTLNGSGEIELSNLVDGSLLAVNQGTFAGNITGGVADTNSLMKNGAGTLELSGANTFVGRSFINAGLLRLASSTALAGGNGLWLQGGDLELDAAGTPTFANALTVLNDATVTVDQNAVWSGTILSALPTTLTKAGAGTLTLTGDNDFFGLVAVDAGSLVIQNAHAADGATFFLSDGDLTFNTPGAPTFDNPINTTGAASLTVAQDTTFDGFFTTDNAGNTLTRQGAGVATFNADSSPYFDGTFVNAAGMTIVNGGLGGNFINSAGAILAGNGSVGSLTNNGTVSPGNSVGRITVNGDFVHNGGLVIEYQPLASGFPGDATHDVVDVTGAATLNAGSTLTLVPSPDYFVNTGDAMHVIQTAAGVTDNGVAILNPSNFIEWDGSVIGNDFVLTAYRNSYTTLAQTDNQQQVATGLDQLANTHLPLDSPSVQLLMTLDLLSPDAFRSALNYMSPEPYDVVDRTHLRTTQGVTQALNNRLSQRRLGVPTTTAQSSGASTMFASRDTNPNLVLLALDPEERDEMAQASRLPGTKISLWAQGFYLYSSQNDASDRTGYNANTGGGMIGADVNVTDNLLAGLMFAYTYTHAGYDGLGGDADINSYRVGPYLSWEPLERLAIDFSVSYAFSQVDASRNVIVGSTASTADANYNAHDLSVYLGAEYDVIPDRQWYVAPLVGFNYVWFHQDAFAESGAGGANLNVNAQDTNSLDLRAGGRFAWYGKISDDFAIIPEAVVAYRRELLADQNAGIGASFINAGGPGFTVSRGPVDENGIEVGAGVTLLINRNFSLYANYSGTFYSSSVNHMATAGLRFDF